MSPIKPTEFRALIELLDRSGVEFILVGGVAASALGSARVTQDLDIVYRRTPENLDRLVAALIPVHPYPRGAPRGLPFVWDRRTVNFGLNFTLDTSIGLIDCLGEIRAAERSISYCPTRLRSRCSGRVARASTLTL